MRRRGLIVGGAAWLGLYGLTRSPIAGLGRAAAQPPEIQPPEIQPPGVPNPGEEREPRDPDHLTPEERAHAPVLTLPRHPRAGEPFDLIVQVGVEPHPMAPRHRVAWIEVRADDARVFAASLGAAVAFPIVRVPLRLDAPTTLSVRAGCNRHGVWRTRREVPVG